MDLARARSALGGTRFATIDWVAETGSTNADLMDAARAGAGERVLGADHQTAGRGRLGRMWQAPPGASILMSVLVRPSLPPSDGHLVTTALGVAAVDAVERVTGFRPGLKWPNDLVAPGAGSDGGDRKLAGMLAQSVTEGDRLGAVVVGLGLNVDWPEVLPPELADIATSLRHLVNGHLVNGDLDATAIVVEMLLAFDRLLDESPDALRTAALADSATIGRRVRVELPDGSVEGDAIDIDSAGCLIVDVDGTTRAFSVGDIVHLRATA